MYNHNKKLNIKSKKLFKNKYLCYELKAEFDFQVLKSSKRILDLDT